MYTFKDVKKDPFRKMKYIPTSAMRYDGFLLEDILEGYTTLKVEGREMTAIVLESTEAKIGAIITNQRLPARIITVTYKLQNKNALELQRDFKELMFRLYRDEDVAISFEDEPTTTYYGRFETADTVEGSSNNIISTFTLFCSDPYKYGAENITIGAINHHLHYPVTPMTVTAKMTKKSTLSIVNGSQTLKITSETLAVNDVVLFDFKNGKVFVNNVDRTNLLDLDSDFSNFQLKTGDRVTSDVATLSIVYRSVEL